MDASKPIGGASAPIDPAKVVELVIQLAEKTQRVNELTSLLEKQQVLSNRLEEQLKRAVSELELRNVDLQTLPKIVEFGEAMQKKVNKYKQLLRKHDDEKREAAEIANVQIRQLAQDNVTLRQQLDSETLHRIEEVKRMEEIIIELRHTSATTLLEQKSLNVSCSRQQHAVTATTDQYAQTVELSCHSVCAQTDAVATRVAASQTQGTEQQQMSPSESSRSSSQGHTATPQSPENAVRHHLDTGSSSSPKDAKKTVKLVFHNHEDKHQHHHHSSVTRSQYTHSDNTTRSSEHHHHSRHNQQIGNTREQQRHRRDECRGACVSASDDLLQPSVMRFSLLRADESLMTRILDDGEVLHRRHIERQIKIHDKLLSTVAALQKEASGSPSSNRVVPMPI